MSIPTVKEPDVDRPDVDRPAAIVAVTGTPSLEQRLLRRLFRLLLVVQKAEGGAVRFFFALALAVFMSLSLAVGSESESFFVVANGLK